MIEISFTTAAHEAGAAGADSADASANGLTDAGTVPLDGFASDGTDSVDSWVARGNVADVAHAHAKTAVWAVAAVSAAAQVWLAHHCCSHVARLYIHQLKSFHTSLD